MKQRLHLSLPYFPAANSTAAHHSSDYYIVGFTVYCIVCVFLTASTGVREIEVMWSVTGWFCLAVMLRGEAAYVRAQVFIAIVFATAGEYFASVYMGGYLYQSGSVPAYIPPGHGMVYLSAIALGRSGLFQRYARKVAIFVLLTGSAWAIWGISGFAPQRDVTGVILFIVFVLCVWQGRNPMVYLGAFFITSWLEVIGTVSGTWTWVQIDPASGLPQGNPPSGVAAYYCLVDAVAIGFAPMLLARVKKIGKRFAFFGID